MRHDTWKLYSNGILTGHRVGTLLAEQLRSARQVLTDPAGPLVVRTLSP